MAIILSTHVRAGLGEVSLLNTEASSLILSTAGPGQVIVCRALVLRTKRWAASFILVAGFSGQLASLFP